MRDTLPLTKRLVRRGGRVVIVGGFDAGAIAISLNWQRIQMSDITSVPGASFAFHDIYAELVEVLDLVACGVLKTQALITHRSRSTGSTRHSRWPRIAAGPEPYSWASRFRGEALRWGWWASGRRCRDPAARLFARPSDLRGESVHQIDEVGDVGVYRTRRQGSMSGRICGSTKISGPQ